MNTLRVVPATAESWPELGRAFGPRAKDPTSCWCQRFRRHDEPDNRAALRREVHEAFLPVGLLAYLGGDVVGWTRVVARWTLPGIADHRMLARILKTIPMRGGCPASWCAAKTAGPASGSLCSRQLRTGPLSTALQFSTATLLTPMASSAPRHHLPSSPALWRCSDKRDSPRLDGPTRPAP